jgi:hypothetical protein
MIDINKFGLETQEHFKKFKERQKNRIRKEIQNTSDYHEIWANDPDSDDDYNMITGGK